MSYLESYAAPNPYVAQAPTSERAAFMQRTYLHLAGAILAFVGLEAVLLNLPNVESIVYTLIGGRYGWLLFLGLFMVAGWIADRWARSEVSTGLQYMGLGLYIVAEAILFLPLLYIASTFSSPEVIPTAGIITLALFGGLTATALLTRIDFSFIGKFLMIGSFLALGTIVAGILFNITLGLFFSVAMVGLAGGYILFTTSQIQHHYRTHQHVAAALSLFASVALMFYYVLRIVMSFSRD